MTIDESLKALNEIKTYVQQKQIEEFDFVIEVLKKLKKDGVKDPLNTDFTKLSK